MSTYLDKASAHLVLADAYKPDERLYRQHMELAAEYRMLAAVERGLVPGDPEGDDR